MNRKDYESTEDNTKNIEILNRTIMQMKIRRDTRRQ